MAPLHTSFAVVADPEVVSDDEVATLEAHGVSEPARRWIAQLAGAELDHVSGLDLRLWTPARIREMDEAYGISARIPTAVAIGAAGSHFLLELRHPTAGVYAAGPGALAYEELTLLAPSVDDFFGRGIGPELTW
jgi:hypothetical protein